MLQGTAPPLTVHTMPQSTLPQHERVTKWDFSIGWPNTPTQFSIANGTVHVWVWKNTCPHDIFSSYVASLSPDEQFRMQKFRFEKDRTRYGISHAIVRMLLSRYLDSDPPCIFFQPNKFGKPYLAETFETNLDFSLSTTGQMGILGIAAGLKIGVDLEEVLPIEQRAVEQYFSLEEQLSLATLKGLSWLEGFYNCWTRKEAILKGEGLGLNVRLDSFEVTLNPDIKPALVRVRPDSKLTSHWHLKELRPGDGLIGALAMNSIPTSISYFQFEEFS